MCYGCRDGSMTGYYYREGVKDVDTFVIFVHGGGGCDHDTTPFVQWVKNRLCCATRRYAGTA